MNLTMKKSLLASAVALSVLASASVSAAVEGNIGAASNYLWRGVTQSNDGAAVSGGLDYSSESGFYAGTWTSSLGGGDYELDLYAGYGLSAAGLDFDLGVISYQYPVSETYFNELYVNTSVSMFSLGLAYTIGSDDDTTGAFSEGDLYASVGADFDLGNEMGLGLTLGSYAFDVDDSGDYTHVSAAVSKGDFTFAIDKTDEDGDAGNPRVSVSWGAAF